MRALLIACLIVIAPSLAYAESCRTFAYGGGSVTDCGHYAIQRQGPYQWQYGQRQRVNPGVDLTPDDYDYFHRRSFEYDDED